MLRIKPNWPKIIVNLLAFIPLAWLVISWRMHALGPNPIQKAEIFLGDTALIMLLLTLTITPLRKWTRINWIGRFRKTFGLQTFYYAASHVFVYLVIDFGLDFRLIWEEFTQRWYLWAGIPAFLILLVMAATSFDFMKLWLRKNWKRIHRFIYLAAILVVIHYLLATKGGTAILGGTTFKPLLAGAIVIVLLLSRLTFKKWFHKPPQVN
jgi:sulfoxide reductase heme-binding subunit YedZ